MKVLVFDRSISQEELKEAVAIARGYYDDIIIIGNIRELPEDLQSHIGHAHSQQPAKKLKLEDIGLDELDEMVDREFKQLEKEISQELANQALKRMLEKAKKSERMRSSHLNRGNGLHEDIFGDSEIKPKPNMGNMRNTW